VVLACVAKPLCSPKLLSCLRPIIGSSLAQASYQDKAGKREWHDVPHCTAEHSFQTRSGSWCASKALQGLGSRSERSGADSAAVQLPMSIRFEIKR